MKAELTREDSIEVRHKLGVLCDTEDLQESYGINQSQADSLYHSVPVNGGEWIIPDWALAVVRGEMEDHVKVMRDQADDARNGNAIGQALTISRQAKRFETIFGLDSQQST